MCLAVPAKIIRLEDQNQALCDMGGVTKTVDVSLTPDAHEGDWVVVHVGFALNKVNEAQAKRTLELLSGAGNQENRA